MRVLVACEYSGTVRDAFIARGHEAWSCDLKPSETPGLHYQGDARHLFDGWVPVRHQCECDPDGDGWCGLTNSDPSECLCIGPTQDDVEYLENEYGLFARSLAHPHWDLMIAHPPCTHLCVSGAKHFAKKRADGRQQHGIDLFMAFSNAPIKRICIENPVGIMSKEWRKADQIIQPYHFGDEAQKTTCLWLKNLPPLQHASEDDWFAKKTHVNRGEMITFASGKQMPKWYSESKTKDGSARSKTFQGIADAMADQWGKL